MATIHIEDGNAQPKPLTPTSWLAAILNTQAFLSPEAKTLHLDNVKLYEQTLILSGVRKKEELRALLWNGRGWRRCVLPEVSLLLVLFVVLLGFYLGFC